MISAIKDRYLRYSLQTVVLASLSGTRHREPAQCLVESLGRAENYSLAKMIVLAAVNHPLVPFTQARFAS